jgi:hypothetical protein
MALEAIYGDDLVVFENKGRLRYFQVSCAGNEYNVVPIVLEWWGSDFNDLSIYSRFTYVTMSLMVSKCALSFQHPMLVPEMSDVLTVLNMTMDLMSSPTLAILSTCLL